jgi:hypothetical protein
MPLPRTQTASHCGEIIYCQVLVDQTGCSVQCDTLLRRSPYSRAEEAERTVRQLHAQLEELQQGLAADQAEAARLRGKLGKRKA